jgi:hypothetical protein
MALLSRICRSAALLALVACGVGACGGGSTGSGPGGNIGAPPTGSGSNGISSGSASTGASGSATSAPNISGSAGSGAARSMDAGDVEAGHPVDAGGGDSSMAPFTGPINGDPNKPMVAVPSVPCGVPNLGLGQSPATVKITNRDVVVVYPCKHEGAAVTFFLFLHGTLNDPQKVSFTMNAFSIHKLVDSHNVIVVVPKAIGTQWGNGDNGQDLPHLYDVVDWVYATFGQKFSIRSMWSQGGSWGAIYLASTFACDPKLQGRLRGVQLVVGGGCPACSDRLSCIVTQQTLQLGNGTALTAAQAETSSTQYNIQPYATKHGCNPKTGPVTIGNDQEWTWANCSPGWAHSYWLGPGNHPDTWDDPAVLKITEEMKATEN